MVDGLAAGSVGDEGGRMSDVEVMVDPETLRSEVR